MKKSLFAALILVLVVGLEGVALAGPSLAVANGEMKASLLVWPQIEVSSKRRVVDADTIITIFNDGPESVLLHCYWLDEVQVPSDFEFEITRFQTVWFKASDGAGMLGGKAIEVSSFHGRQGELKCFAVNNEDLPITKNNLSGTATIFDFADGDAIRYNAYGFKRSGDAGTAGVLTLNGSEYDHCPAYLLGTFMLDGAGFADKQYTVTAGTSKLTLVPCDQDLRQDRLPVYAKANFTVWDEDEVAATGAYICFKCWVDTTLTDPPVASKGAKALTGFHNFTAAVVGGVYATVKITPVFGGTEACTYPGGVTSLARPFIGLLIGSTGFNGFSASSGSLLHSTSTAWAGAAPTIKYDVAGATPERNVR
jgi:hypothetical protein